MQNLTISTKKPNNHILHVMRTFYNIKGTLAALGCVALLLTGCDNRRLGSIEGNISGAEGQLLVLEHLTDGAPRLVDTLRLSADGKFQFKPEIEQGPDFFSLRLGTQSISLVVDTLLTPIQVSADAANLSSGYTVQDAQNKELQEAVLLGNRLRGQILGVNKLFNDGGISRDGARDSILTLVQNYKTKVLETYIYRDPSSATSYYLLFETVQGLMVFEPSNGQDIRAFGAVATGWQFHYPASPRNRILEKMTIQGQQRRRAELAQAQRAERADSVLSNTPIETRTYPELNLTDIDDHAVSLTKVAEGSTVVLDFTAFYMDYSPAHNMALSALFEKYGDKGLKIYQVCLDFDEHFWKTSAGNLPWNCVRDRNVLFDQNGNIQYAPSAQTYNVSKLPTLFIINDKGEIQTRIEGDDTKIEQEIKKIIK